MSVTKMNWFFTLLLSTLAHFSFSQNNTPGCLDSLKIPEAFSPNGDSRNDGFSINFPCAPDQFEIAIYNRWGEELFHSKNFGFVWSGFGPKDQPLENGVYVYLISIEYQGKEQTINGQITLMR